MRGAFVLMTTFAFFAGVGMAEEPVETSNEAAVEEATPDAGGRDVVDASESTAAKEATAAEKAAVEEEVAKYFRRYGYVAVQKSGQTFYCRDEAPFGSRVKKTTCITEEIAKQRREEARRLMEEKFGKRSWVEGM